MASLREAAKGVVITGYGKYGSHTYNIGFNDGDETQLEAHNLKELDELWRSLCPEFGCRPDAVDYVERIA